MFTQACLAATAAQLHLKSQDGQNLFFPHEAFKYKDGGVKETSQILRAMHAIDDCIIVGVYSGERREEEYTKPGYEAYARSMVEELSVAMDWTQGFFFGREIEQT